MISFQAYFLTESNTAREADVSANKALDSLSDQWEERGIESFVSAHRGSITLNKIKIAKESRGQGLGSVAMRELLELAQRYHMRVLLTPSKVFGASSVGRLEKFYKSFGFKPNKGRTKDYTTRESMIWTP